MVLNLQEYVKLMVNTTILKHVMPFPPVDTGVLQKGISILLEAKVKTRN